MIFDSCRNGLKERRWEGVLTSCNKLEWPFVGEIKDWLFDGLREFCKWCWYFMYKFWKDSGSFRTIREFDLLWPGDKIYLGDEIAFFGGYSWESSILLWDYLLNNFIKFSRRRKISEEVNHINTMFEGNTLHCDSDIGQRSRFEPESWVCKRL